MDAEKRAEQLTSNRDRRCRHCGTALDPNVVFCSRCGASAELPGGGRDSLREKLRALFGAELEIEHELGRGGMAAVYAGFDPGLRRRVAIKALLPEIASEPGAADRFLREARTVAALQHPHVVTVYAVRAGAEVQALVMQFVDGRSLDVVLKERAPLPVHVAGMILAQVADGLLHAHERGVAHRDVKPSNVLLESEGHAVVSDFGIARREDSPRTTETGLVVGTWAYMSPEQREGKPTTAATDQYAFGVMAFEVLTGRLPFQGTPSEILRAHKEDAPPSLRALRPDVPPGVEALVHRMLAKRPEERFPSLRDAQRVFHSLVPDEGQTTLVLAGLSHVRAVAKPAVEVAAAPRRSRVPMVGAVVAVVLVAGAVALWATRGRTSGPPVAGGAGTTTPVASTGTAPSAPRAPSATPQPAERDQNARGGRVDRPVAGSSSAVPAAAVPSSGERGGDAPRLPASTDPAAARSGAAPAAAPADSGARNAPPVSLPAAPPAPTAHASIEDARRAGREFVTMLNQRRWREVEQLGAFGGDATLRAELIRLTRSAADFEAGFDRYPSLPVAAREGFETEFVVDLSWRGGKKLMLVHLSLTMRDGAWHLAGFGAEPAE